MTTSPTVTGPATSPAPDAVRAQANPSQPGAGIRHRILSGMQPSADSLHLGNYLGALVNWVIRDASPKPVMQFRTQASWACSGTWD